MVCMYCVLMQDRHNCCIIAVGPVEGAVTIHLGLRLTLGVMALAHCP